MEFDRHAASKKRKTPPRALRASKMTKKPAVNIAIDPAAETKALGGGDRDQWNERLVGLVIKALPVNHPTRSKSVAVVLEFSAKGGMPEVTNATTAANSARLCSATMVWPPLG